MIKKKLLGSLAALALFLTVGAKAAPVHAASMSRYVTELLCKNHMRGAVTVVENGRSKTIGVGYANYGRQIKNSDQAVYPTASLQKAVTAAMLMQVMRESRGKKHFTANTKISKWYPRLKSAKQITVSDLLTHTSGYYVYNLEDSRKKVYTEKGAIDWTINQVNSTWQYPVGSYHYNDTNYMLLAGIIQKQTGKSYAYNLRKRIVKKLRLTHTCLRENLPSSLHLAKSYLYLGRNYQAPVLLPKSVASQMPGAGDLISTPYEYLQIQRGLHNGKLLSKKQFSEMTHMPSKATTYCGGIYLKKSGKVKLAYGSIAYEHYATYYQLTTDNRYGMVMFLNQRNASENQVKAVGYQILSRIKAGTFARK